MTLSHLIVMIVCAFFVLLLVLFPSFRKKLKVLISGFLNLWVEDKAKTPEGAKAIYTEAIEEAQEKYNIANDAYKRIYGKLDSFKNKKVETEEQLKVVESQCESLVVANKIQAAEIKAEQREALIQQLKMCEKMITELTPRVNDAKRINNECEKRLRTLKQKSKEIVEGLQMNQQLQEIYDDLDEVKKTTATSKLLENIDDAYENSKNVVAGSKALYDNKITTKIEKANNDAAKASTDAYLSSLKLKYNKKGE